MTPGHQLSSRLLGIWTLCVCLFIVAPLLALVAVSFTAQNFLSLSEGALSLKWYAQLKQHPLFLEAGINSIVLAGKAALTSMFLGVLAALAIVRYRFPMREVVRLALMSPLFIPMVMSGLAILVFFAAMGWESAAMRLYVAHTALTIPYVVRVMSASLTGFDINQELAARNLGASPLKAFLLITLPQLGPGIIAGAIFAFIVSFDNVGLSIFLTGSEYKTLPVELLVYVENNNDPMSAALSVVMLVLSVAVVVVVEKIVGLQRMMRV